MNYRLKTLCLVALLPLLVWGQSKLSPHTRQQLHALRSAEPADPQHPARRAVRAPAGSGTLSAFIVFNEGADPAALEACGVRLRTVTRTMATADIPLDRLDAVAALPEVRYIDAAREVSTRLDEVRRVSHINEIHHGTDLPQGFDGTGVVVGVIDTGFEYGHVNFYDSLRRELRIRRVWEQKMSEGTPPAGYDYGTEYATPEAILGKKSDSDGTGHATHVTGIAAGAAVEPGRDYKGVAPGADLVLVSLETDAGMENGDNTTVLDGIKYIYDYADEVGKPCVINMSLGSHLGPHDGMSAFDRMTDELQGPGRLLVGAVGNEGQDKLHLSKTFDGLRPDTLKSFYKFNYEDIGPYSTLDVWGDAGMAYQFIPVLYNEAEGRVETMYDPITVSVGSEGMHSTEFRPETDGFRGELLIISEINPLNGKPHMDVRTVMYKEEGYRWGFYIVSEDAGTVHLWADNFYSNITNHGIAGFTDGDTDCTMGEIGGTGKRIISVGAYVSKDKYTHYGLPYYSGEVQDSIASYSSHGPTADGRVKPDITAPGSYVVSSLSWHVKNTKYQVPGIRWNEDLPNSHVFEFGFMQGTSMAAPVVTGTLALWLQALPELTPEQAKAALQATAVGDAKTGELPGNTWGYGKLDAWRGLQYCFDPGSGTDAPQAGHPLLATAADGVLSLFFTASLAEADVRLYDAGGRRVAAARWSGVAGGEERTLALDGCPEGVYVLRTTHDNGTDIQKIIIR